MNSIIGPTYLLIWLGWLTVCEMTPNSVQSAPPRKVTPEKQPQFNALDGNVDRRSHSGKYEVVGGVPR